MTYSESLLWLESLVWSQIETLQNKKALNTMFLLILENLLLRAVWMFFGWRPQHGYGQIHMDEGPQGSSEPDNLSIGTVPRQIRGF